MKECPVCQHKLDDNARFCLRCMTPLNQKRTVPPLKRGKGRWLLLWGCVSVAAVMLLGLCLLLLRSGDALPEAGQPARQNIRLQSRQTSDPGPNRPGTTGQTGGSDRAEDIPAEGEGSQTPIVLPDQGGAPAVTPSAGTNTPSATTAPSATAAPTQATTVPTKPTGPSLPAEVLGNGIPGSEGYRTSLSQSDPYEDMHQPFTDEGGLAYTLATAANMGDESYVNPGNEYVACSVGSCTRSGIYDMTVMDAWLEAEGNVCVAISERTFAGSDAVKVIISPEVRYIGAHVFNACDELAYVYLTGDRVRIHPNAFATSAPRRYTVYLYCSAQCQDGNGNYYKDIAGRYGLVWREWNG